MAQWLSERLGQQFVIENRPGAAGNIATEAVEESVSYFTLRWLSKNSISNRALASAQSKTDSAQVTAPGAMANMIAAVSTRPNRQNRSTWSRMSVPLVQKQKLGLVDRFGRRSRRSQIAA